MAYTPPIAAHRSPTSRNNGFRRVWPRIYHNSAGLRRARLLAHAAANAPMIFHDHPAAAVAYYNRAFTYRARVQAQPAVFAVRPQAQRMVHLRQAYAYCQPIHQL